MLFCKKLFKAIVIISKVWSITWKRLHGLYQIYALKKDF